MEVDGYDVYQDTPNKHDKDNPYGNPHPDRALMGGILFLLLGHAFVCGRLVFVLFVVHLYDRLHFRVFFRLQ